MAGWGIAEEIAGFLDEHKLAAYIVMTVIIFACLTIKMPEGWLYWLFGSLWLGYVAVCLLMMIGLLEYAIWYLVHPSQLARYIPAAALILFLIFVVHSILTNTDEEPSRYPELSREELEERYEEAETDVECRNEEISELEAQVSELEADNEEKESRIQELENILEDYGIYDY